MKRYKTVTVHCRGKIIDFHKIKGDIFDITYQKRVRVKQKKPIPPTELTFLENGYVITWGDESAHFTPQTFRLLQEFWFAEEHRLSK